MEQVICQLAIRTVTLELPCQVEVGLAVSLWRNDQTEGCNQGIQGEDRLAKQQLKSYTIMDSN